MQSMKCVRWTKLTFLLLLTTLWQAGAVRADDKILSDRRLPKETFLHVSIGNVPEFSKQFNKTAGGKLFQDKALSDFWKEIHGKVAEKQKEVEKAIGTELADLPGLAQGEVSVAFCKAGTHGIAFVGFFHYGNKQELVNKLIEKAEKALIEEEELKRSEQEISEVKVIVLKKDGDEAAENPFQSICYFQKDGTLVVSTDVEAIKQVLSRWDGQHDATLAKNEIYKYIADKSRDEQSSEAAALTWYLDPVGGFTSVVTAPKATPQMGMAMMFLPMVGANKIRGWGGRLEFPAGDDIDSVMRSILYMDQPASGVTNLLQFDSDAQSPPKWVRSDVASYAGFNWDLQKALTGVESLLDLKGPGTMAQLLEGLAQQGPKVHLRKDLLDHATGHFHVLSKSGEGTGAKAAQTRLVIALELKDAAAVKRTITKVMASAPPTVKTREFQGETLYEVPMPDGGQLGGGKGDDAGGPKSAGMVIAEGQLMFSNDVTLLEQVLRSKSDQEQLSESPIYKRIAKKFPAKTTSITFSRSDEQVRAAYEMLRSGALTKGATDAPDFSKLPEFSVLQKYFAPSGGYSVPDEHGLKSVTFSLSGTGSE